MGYQRTGKISLNLYLLDRNEHLVLQCRDGPAAGLREKHFPGVNHGLNCVQTYGASQVPKLNPKKTKEGRCLLQAAGVLTPGAHSRFILDREK